MTVITNMWAADPLGNAVMNYGAFKHIFGNFKVVPIYVVKADRRYSSTHSSLATRWRRVVKLMFRQLFPRKKIRVPNE